MSPDDDRPGSARPPWESGGERPATRPDGPPGWDTGGGDRPPRSPGPGAPPPAGPHHPAGPGSGTGGWSPAPPHAPSVGWGAGPGAASGAGWGAGTSPGWATAGGPAGAWVPTPPRRRRLGWLVGVLVLLWVVGIAAAVVVGVLVSRAAGPVTATGKVLDHLEDREYRAAYDASCQGERDRFTFPQYVAAFEALARSNGAIEDTGVDFDVDMHGGSSATVGYWIRFDRSGRRRFATMVVKEAGRWRPCLLSENPSA